MHNSLTIFTSAKTERLLYVLDWIFTECLQINYTIKSDRAIDDDRESIAIGYGLVIPGGINIPSSGLIEESGIHTQDIATGSWENIPTLYAAEQNEYTIPFDIFSAVFFLVSRYEEYYHYTPDKHGRYPATESILYKNKWLERPLVDEWLLAFRRLLEKSFHLQVAPFKFSYLPTYDIDIAWSYKHKGGLRNAGGLVKNLLSLQPAIAAERLQVLSGVHTDPFDSFSFLKHLHTLHHYKPIYFILAALSTGPFDKNIHPMHPAMQNLIKSLAEEGDIGMHPSYETDNSAERFRNEKHVLQDISGRSIHLSRQHYVKMILPVTYRNLLAYGINTDYSMGYGTKLGFRAGTGRSFLWYDLENEKLTGLRVYPFCFMDSTAHYENSLHANFAFDTLRQMAERLKNTSSLLITVFHNFSLGTDKEWSGWATQYERFLADMAEAIS